MSDVSTAEQLVHLGNILNIIIGAISIVALVLSKTGIIFVPVPIVLMWWTNKRVKAAEELIKKGDYRGAKDMLIVPSILSMLFVSLIGGLLILIGAVMLPGGREQATSIVD